ncbi:MAG: hypothetical protein ABI874_00445 [Chloroflexota bacterium]
MNVARLTQIILVAAGLGYLLIGLTQLLAPQWFFTNVGNFPPFNRHYVGDLGAFTLPLGVGLLFAARAPRQHRSLIGVGAGISTLHALNHLYDDLVTGPAAFAQTLSLLLLAALLIVAWFAAKE